MPVLVTLKKVREDRGLSQNELARRTGYSLQNIQKIEQNRSLSITFEALEKFCSVLQCQPGDILYWESDDTEEAGVSPSDETSSIQTDSHQTKKSGSKRKPFSERMVAVSKGKGAA
jgi:putative transcriptional regulator